MIITVTLNPAIDKTAQLEMLEVNELNRLTNVILDAGGKGINVSKAIQELGGTSICTGFIAGTNGKWIQDELVEKGLECRFKEVPGNTRMNLKVLDKEMNLTELNETGLPISKEDIESFTEQLINMCNPGDTVVLAGSVPAGVEKNIYFDLTKLLKSKGMKVVLDADGELFDLGIEAGPSVIKPNKYELCKYFDLSKDISDEEMVEHAKKLLDKGMETIAISLGSRGAIFVRKEKVAYVKGLKIKAHSAVGAGDSMVGAISYAMEQQLNFEDFITLAVATSAGAVMTEGTKAPSIDVVKGLMEQVEIEFKD
ncbi:1-phosphofructokinase [Tannockella kyphosi]|uniref:1-phosphofructokinase n=1 Tax=Tannockella kyphosi TaxID=2899121 RepID=UPI002011144E|nr:1-phosphofructokinase [Tannockella kyphosi]